jgi:2-enoate reductase
MLPDVATGMHDANRSMLLEMLAENHARILTNTRLQEVTEDGVITTNSDSKSNLIKSDTVALAVGLRSEKEIFEWLNNKNSAHVREIYSVGDCNKPRKIHHAIWDGGTVATSI